MGRCDCAGREIDRVPLLILMHPKVYAYVTKSLQRINLIRPWCGTREQISSLPKKIRNASTSSACTENSQSFQSSSPYVVRFSKDERAFSATRLIEEFQYWSSDETRWHDLCCLVLAFDSISEDIAVFTLVEGWVWVISGPSDSF